MLERIRTAFTADPWRTAAVALALALLAVTIGLVLALGDEEPVIAADSTTPTATSATSTTRVTGPTSTVSTEERGSSPSAVDVAVAIKIDNSRGARPQWGLSEAPLLVEHFVEGPISRFTAVVPAGLTGLMGPIRSLRPVDADLLPVISRVVVSSGGRPFVVQDVEATGIQNIVAGFSSMFSSVGNADPYDTFVDLALLDGIVAAAPGTTPGIPAGDLPVPSGVAEELFLPFEGATLRYAPGLGWLHERAGEPFMVLDTSGSNLTQLAHDVVVVVFANERFAGYTDVNDVPVMTYDVIGGGELLVLHEGEAFLGTWRRDSLEDGFEFFDTSGNSIGLPQGHVYMAIVPRDSQVSYR